MTTEILIDHEREVESTIKEAYRVGVHAAIDASNLVLKYWPNPLNRHFDRDATMKIFDKYEGVGNFATIADLESEELLIQRIRGNRFLKDHDIITEEQEIIQSGSDWQWVNDPIDGTLNFTNGLPDFAVSVGLLHKGEPVLGIITLPESQRMLVAQKDKGAALMSFSGKYLGDLTDLSQRSTLPLRKSIVSYDVSYVDRQSQFAGYVSRIADNVGAPTSYYSCATAQAKLAEGLIGAYVMAEPKIFDVGAGACILKEAGCVVSQMDGSPIDWKAQSRTYLASRNKEIHSELLSLINK